MHTIAEAVFEGFAMLALSLAGPFAMAEGLEAGVPDFPEVVGVDVALTEMLAVDVGAGADGAVDEDGGDVDTGVAEIGGPAHFVLVGAEITLAGEGGGHRGGAGGAFLGDEVHELDELGVGEVEFGVVEGATDGDDGEDAPLLDAEGGELVVDFLQVGEVALVDAGDDVEVEAGLFCGDGDGIDGAGVAAGTPPHPVVVFLESVETDGEGSQACGHELVVHLLVVEPAIADDAPTHAALAEGLADFGEVGSQEGFAAGDDDGEGVGTLVCGDGVECPEKVLEGHVLLAATGRAVAAAVAAVEIAARGALPEEVVEFVHAGLVVAEETEKEGHGVKV